MDLHSRLTRLRPKWACGHCGRVNVNDDVVAAVLRTHSDARRATTLVDLAKIEFEAGDYERAMDRLSSHWLRIRATVKFGGLRRSRRFVSRRSAMMTTSRQLASRRTGVSSGRRRRVHRGRFLNHSERTLIHT